MELYVHNDVMLAFGTDSFPIGVSADSCPADASWLRDESTKFIPITPYTRVANKKLL